MWCIALYPRLDLQDAAKLVVMPVVHLLGDVVRCCVGASLALADGQGLSPLHVAAIRGRHEVWLLGKLSKRGGVSDRHRVTPGNEAGILKKPQSNMKQYNTLQCGTMQTPILSYLIYYAVLCCAIYYTSCMQAVRFLIQSKAMLDTLSTDGGRKRTALHYAAWYVFPAL